MSDTERRPLRRFDTDGSNDYFLIGVVGEADSDGWQNNATVELVSFPEGGHNDADPVGFIELTAIRGWFDAEHEDDRATPVMVTLDGTQAAMLALVLQDAARQWHERDISHNWSRPVDPTRIDGQE